VYGVAKKEWSNGVTLLGTLLRRNSVRTKEQMRRLLLLLLSLPHSYSTQIQASSSQRRWCSKIGNMAWLVEERKGISFDHGDQVARLYSC